MEKINRAIVIGAGAMGEGIAQIFAQAGYPVLLADIDPKGMERCLDQIRRNLAMLNEYGLNPGEPDTVLSRISTVQLKGLSDAGNLPVDGDLVVEVIPEKLDLKKELFKVLDTFPADILLASNTSSLTISQITEGMEQPERVVGLHFFYPAHLIPLVEIHGSSNTSPDALSFMKALMKKIGKVPVLVKKEIPGFIVNRIQAAYNREVTYLLDQGVASAEDLDLAAKAGFGFRLACLGPLEIHDLNGLDVVMHAGAKTRQAICNDRSHSPSLVEKVEKGELGVKTGKGWHDYQGRTPSEVKDEANAKLLRQLALFNRLNQVIQ